MLTGFKVGGGFVDPGGLSISIQASTAAEPDG
jgi:hypothetical protein